MIPPIITQEEKGLEKIKNDFFKCLDWLPNFGDNQHVVSSHITPCDKCMGYKGSLCEFSLQLSPSQKKLYINWIEVFTSMRRRGIGSAIMFDIEKFARLSGCEVVEATPSGMGVEFFPGIGYQWHGQVVRKTLQEKPCH